MSKHFTMKNLPKSERPYEKLIEKGPESLSDAELLAVILKTGTKEETSVELARRLLSGNHNNLLNLYDLSYRDLLQFPGIGSVKAVQLKAVAELSRRIAKTQNGYTLCLENPKSLAAYYMEELRHQKEEILKCAFFDAKCKFLGDVVISKGGVNYTFVPPREIFLHAFDFKAVQLVLIHNHPSGDPTPSQDDINITSRIQKGARILELILADHIIIGDKSYYSFCEEKQLS